MGDPPPPHNAASPGSAAATVSPPPGRNSAAESNAVNSVWHEGYGATTVSSQPQVRPAGELVVSIHFVDVKSSVSQRKRLFQNAALNSFPPPVGAHTGPHPTYNTTVQMDYSGAAQGTVRAAGGLHAALTREGSCSVRHQCHGT